MTQTKNIIIAVAMKPMLTSQGGRDMWKHSIRCAVACEYLAEKTGAVVGKDYLMEVNKVENDMGIIRF